MPPAPPLSVQQAVRTVLTRDPPHDWQALSGGRTNFAWRGRRGGRDIVLKLYSGPARNPLFPNDPQAEARLLAHLGPTGICPEWLATLDTEAGTCNLYTHIPGRTWQGALTGAARVMRRLHRTTPLTGLRAAPNGSAALAAQTRAILAQCRDGAPLLALAPAVDLPPTAQQVLLHSDIVPGNLIENADGLHLIDWQCPATGDPCEDVAIFLSPAMQQVYRGAPLDRAQVETFLGAYGDAAVTDRYRTLAPLYHWRMAAYCLWQSENDRPDYRAALALELEALSSH